MSRKKVENRKVPMGVSVLQSTKDYIQANHIKAGDILDNMFSNEDSKS